MWIVVTSRTVPEGTYVMGCDADINNSSGNDLYIRMEFYQGSTNVFARYSYNTYSERQFTIVSGMKFHVMVQIQKGATVNSTIYPKIYKIS